MGTVFCFAFSVDLYQNIRDLELLYLSIYLYIYLDNADFVSAKEVTHECQIL